MGRHCTSRLGAGACWYNAMMAGMGWTPRAELGQGPCASGGTRAAEEGGIAFEGE